MAITKIFCAVFLCVSIAGCRGGSEADAGRQPEAPEACEVDLWRSAVGTATDAYAIARAACTMKIVDESFRFYIADRTVIPFIKKPVNGIPMPVDLIEFRAPVEAVKDCGPKWRKIEKSELRVTRIDGGFFGAFTMSIGAQDERCVLSEEYFYLQASTQKDDAHFLLRYGRTELFAALRTSIQRN